VTTVLMETSDVDEEQVGETCVRPAPCEKVRTVNSRGRTRDAAPDCELWARGAVPGCAGEPSAVATAGREPGSVLRHVNNTLFINLTTMTGPCGHERSTRTALVQDASPCRRRAVRASLFLSRRRRLGGRGCLRDIRRRRGRSRTRRRGRGLGDLRRSFLLQGSGLLLAHNFRIAAHAQNAVDGRRSVRGGAEWGNDSREATRRPTNTWGGDKICQSNMQRVKDGQEGRDERAAHGRCTYDSFLLVRAWDAFPSSFFFPAFLPAAARFCARARSTSRWFPRDMSRREGS
jgi:hypothetical protein